MLISPLRRRGACVRGGKVPLLYYFPASIRLGKKVAVNAQAASLVGGGDNLGDGQLHWGGKKLDVAAVLLGGCSWST